MCDMITCIVHKCEKAFKLAFMHANLVLWCALVFRFYRLSVFQEELDRHCIALLTIQQSLLLSQSNNQPIHKFPTNQIKAFEYLE